MPALRIGRDKVRTPAVRPREATPSSLGKTAGAPPFSLETRGRLPGGRRAGCAPRISRWHAIQKAGVPQGVLQIV